MKLFSLFLLVTTFVISSAVASNQLGFNQQLHEQIAINFKDADQFSDEKIDFYNSHVTQRKNELTHAITNFESKLKQEDSEEVAKELAKSDTLFTYNLILNYLEKIKTSENYIEKMNLAREILELDFATKVTGSLSTLSTIVGVVKNFPGTNRLHKTINTEGEASNLFNKKTKEFYTQAELQELKNNGEDISLIDPKDYGRFWYKRDIRNTDLRDVIKGKTTLLYSGINIELPKKKGKFKKLRTTQSKPKIDITYKVKDPLTGEKKKRTFKLKLASEMHGEITTASLLGAIGYHTDLSHYVRDFKVTLPKEMTLEDLKKEWYSYDRFRSYDVDELISETGVDDKGRTYIVFIEGLIETKPDELVRVGPWGYGSVGHKGLREIRGLHLFNIWLANNDTKEADNNKLVLKKMPDGSYRSFQFLHDVGFAFGHILKEKPQSYKWNVVSKNTPTEIGFHYLAFQPNSGFEHVTFADARWMVRKIGQFSRKQIKTAVKLGGWPKDIGKLLVEKLISRRNDLVKAFELEEELALIDFDRNITTKSGAIKNGNIVNENFEGYTQTFGGEFDDLIGPAKDLLEKLVVQGARQLTKLVDSTVIAADTLGIDSSLVAEVELDISREIIINPNPLGIDDNFIVQDTFRARYALGAGLILRGKGAYFQEFKLLYPVKTHKEGMYHNKFIFNALLPRTVKSGKLPENYVLIVNQGIEGEGEILLGTNLGASVGVSFTTGRMSGSVISKRPDEYTVVRDSTKYNKLMARIYAELFILRIPVIETSKTKGILLRNAYKVDLKDDDAQTKAYKLSELTRFIRTGNFDAIEGFGENTEIRSDYVTKHKEAKLFLYNFRGERRTDTIERVRTKKNGDVDVDNIFQVKILKKQGWKIVSGEVKTRHFRFKGEIDSDGWIEDPLLDIKLEIKDDNTKTKELRDHYIKSINQLALNSKFIQFTPELYSRNNVWGVNNVSLRMMYDSKALDKLVETPEDTYYEIMGRYSNMSADWWKSKRRDDSIDRSTTRLRRKYQKFVNAMKKASVQQFDRAKYEIVIEAFNDIITRKGQAFEIVLLQRIHSILGRDNYFFEGYITIPGSKEMRYPEKTPLYNVMNPEIFTKQKFIEFDYVEVLEAWDLYF